MLNKSKRKKLYCKQTGFSLMELCVVVAIIALMAAIGIPNFLGMKERYRLRSSATTILSVFKKARTEAIKRNVSVALIFNDAGNGTYSMFVDDGNGGGTANNMKRDGTEQQLLDPSTTKIQSGNSLVNETLTPPDPLTLNPDGFPGVEFSSNGLPTSTGAIRITGAASLSVIYRVAVSVAGNTILEDSTDGGATWQ